MEIGRDRYGFRPIDQAGATQQRSEIMHFAAMIENLAVKTGQEFRQAHVLLARDFFKRVPERHLEPDRCAMAIDAKRSGLRFIVPLRLVSEQLAHGYPPDLSYNFSKRYTGSAPGANVSVIRLHAIGTTGWPHPFAQLSFFEASTSLGPRRSAQSGARTGRIRRLRVYRPAPLLPCGFEQADRPADRAAAKRQQHQHRRRERTPGMGFGNCQGHIPMRQFRWRHARYAR